MADIVSVQKFDMAMVKKPTMKALGLNFFSNDYFSYKDVSGLWYGSPNVLINAAYATGLPKIRDKIVAKGNPRERDLKSFFSEMRKESAKLHNDKALLYEPLYYLQTVDTEAATEFYIWELNRHIFFNKLYIDFIYKSLTAMPDFCFFNGTCLLFYTGSVSKCKLVAMVAEYRFRDYGLENKIDGAILILKEKEAI